MQDCDRRLDGYERVRRFAWRWAHKRVLEGVPVGIFLMPRDRREVAFEKIARALALLRRHCPRRFAHLRSDVGGIIVFSGGGFDGRWLDRLRLCELNDDYLRDAAPADIASTRVHEAMHARLFRRGFGYGEGDERARVEAACYRAQRAFARRLPPELRSPEMAEEADAWVRALEDPSSGVVERYFSDEAYAERCLADLDNSVQQLRDAEAPKWLVRAVEALSRRRLRRWQQRQR